MVESAKRFRISLAEIMMSCIVVAVACVWPATLSLILPTALLIVAARVPDPSNLRDHITDRYFHRVMVPVCWSIASWISWNRPGDEYGLFIVSALAATWILPLLSFGNLREILPLIFIAGIITTFLMGWSLDRIRARRLPWLVGYVGCAAVLVYWSISAYPSYQRAISKNGSFAAYVAGGLNLSLYLTSLAAFAMTALKRWIAAVISLRARS